MGSVIYDFLNDSFLFDGSLIHDNYSSVSESDLKQELVKYRDFVMNNAVTLRNEIIQDQYRLRVFGAKDYFSIQNLMQTAFYFDQVVLPDLILPFVRIESNISKTMTQFLGMNKSDSIDRQSLSNAITKMKQLTPMVAANYVKFFPVSYYLEPADEIPITYSENGYSDILHSNILSEYRSKAEVKSLKKCDNGWIVEETLNLGRGIAIQFQGDNDENVHIYNLFEQEIVKFNEDTKIAHFVMTLPEEPPTSGLFQAWVNQSINKAAGAHYEEMIKGLLLSSSFGASYLTCSEFSNSLLGSDVSKKSISQHTSECVMNMELPFLSNISMIDLMNVRQNDGEAFEIFRRELESRLRELRSEADPEIIRLKIENAVHELSEVQVAKIDQKVKGLSKGALAQVVVAAGGLAGSVVTSGVSIAASVIALASGFRTYAEYREKVRENPAYFLWKVKNA